jgi:ligand-binding sensor domain-containing protein
VHVHNGVTDLFTQADGLSGEDVAAIFEDREGNIWIATEGGLDRFRASSVVSYTAHQGLSNTRLNSVSASSDGGVWVGTYDGLNRWSTGAMAVYRQRHGQRAPGSAPILARRVREFTGAGMPRGVQSVFEDSQRRVWLSTASGVGYLENDRFVLMSGIPGGVTRAIVEDGQRNLWVANQAAGLFRRQVTVCGSGFSEAASFTSPTVRSVCRTRLPMVSLTAVSATCWSTRPTHSGSRLTADSVD